jgi:hypothetical protein
MGRRYRIGTGLAEFPTGGDEDIKQMLVPLYRAINELAKQLSDITGLTEFAQGDIQGMSTLLEHDQFRLQKFSFIAAEPITYGKLVHLDSTADESKVWLASSLNSVNRPAHGVCTEQQATASGLRCRVQLFQGLVTGLSGLSPGTMYYLGATGTYSATPPSLVTNFQQKVALAIRSDMLVVNIQ